MRRSGRGLMRNGGLRIFGSIVHGRRQHSTSNKHIRHDKTQWFFFFFFLPSFSSHVVSTFNILDRSPPCHPALRLYDLKKNLRSWSCLLLSLCHHVQPNTAARNESTVQFRSRSSV